MLKNKTKEDVILKYNGMHIKVESGKKIDIRDFDVANKDVAAVEKHLIAKYPGTFKAEKSTGDSKHDQEVDDRVKDLTKENEALQKKVDELTEANKELAENVQTKSGELQSETERANSLKTETDAAVEKVEGLEKEIEDLRLQISQGKTGDK